MTFDFFCILRATAKRNVRKTLCFKNFNFKHFEGVEMFVSLFLRYKEDILTFHVYMEKVKIIRIFFF